jgi:hypothetical protein
LTIETLTLRDAFKYATEQGFGQVIFEVDCAELMKCWHKRLEERSVIRPILDEISELSLFFYFF